MCSKSEKDTLVSLASSKGFGLYHSGDVINTNNGVGTFFVYSPNGKPFKAGLSLTAATNYLNSF